MRINRNNITGLQAFRDAWHSGWMLSQRGFCAECDICSGSDWPLIANQAGRGLVVWVEPSIPTEGCHTHHERIHNNPKTYDLLLSRFLCQTGVVHVNRPLDRERVAEYRLSITVKDNPENSRIARRVSSLCCAQ